MPETYRQDPRTAGRVIDGHAVVITTHDETRSHTLNRLGSYIWVLAEDGCTLDEITRALSSRFDVSPDRARSDAKGFLDDLVRRGILERVP